jgi:hypothetical protein
MLQGILWFLNDPISDLLLAGILVFAAMHHRQVRLRLMQQRTNLLSLQVSELKMLIMNMPGGSASNGPSLSLHSPSMRFDETTLSTLAPRVTDRLPG